MIDMTGKRLGRLLVLKEAGRTRDCQILWECRCDCGNIRSVRGYSLRNGKTTSCGCYNREITSKKQRTHGLSKTRLYCSWNTMIQRCTNPNVSRYPNYGGRGIKVCKEWRVFENFAQWALAHGYKENSKGRTMAIDRIDNNGDYTPSNCRYVDYYTNSNNTRKSKKWTVKNITFNSRTLAAKHFGVSIKTISNWCSENRKPGCCAVKKYEVSSC